MSDRFLKPSRRIDVKRLMKKLGIGNSRSFEQDIDQPLEDLILEAEQANQHLLTIVARLQSYRKPRLPRDTRLRWLKQVMLRIIMVYSRYQDLYNSANVAAIQALNERLDFIQRQIELLTEQQKPGSE